MSTEEEWHIEMTWRCATCRRQNLGRHKECLQCGKPKSPGEPFEMPADISRAARVSDAALLRMASSGPDWQCAYCQSMQRSLEGRCVRCGASPLTSDDVPAGAPPRAPQPPLPFSMQPGAGAYPHAAPTAWPPTANYAGQPGMGAAPPARPSWGFLKIFALIASPVVLMVALVLWATRPRDFTGTVATAEWTHTIDVERYALRPHEGFIESRPADALEVQSLGPRVHHHEQVLDHYETEFYTERVSDGYRSETYTERVSCGQDCTSSPRSCRNVCSSSGNGFARCREVCSGGGQRCSTRYCNETRTRQVPQYRNETRSRQVPRYRSEPRYAEFFAWRAWTWEPDRTATLSGTTPATMRWPDAEAHLGANLGPGENERARRTALYVVSIRYDEGRETVWYAPPSAEHFSAWVPGRAVAVHTEGSYREVRDPSTHAVLLSHPSLLTSRPTQAMPISTP